MGGLWAGRNFFIAVRSPDLQADVGRIWGLGFRVWGLGFQGSGTYLRVSYEKDSASLGYTRGIKGYTYFWEMPTWGVGMFFL